MAASLKSLCDEDVTITAGKSGQFDVLADGELIFSKAQTGRFPLDDEVEKRFADLRAGKDLAPIEAKKAGVVGKVLGKLRR